LPGLTKREIADKCSSFEVFVSGKRYYHEGAIIELSYDKIGNYYHAVVERGRTYVVNIFLDEHYRAAGEICNCPAFNSYEGCCEHIAAVLLSLAHKNRNVAKSWDDRLVEGLLEHYDRQGSISSADKSELALELTLIIRPFSSYLGGVSQRISLKVGQSRLYVVKDIGKFLMALCRDEEFIFGKNFIYDPQIHTFSCADRLVIDCLLEWLKIERHLIEQDQFSRGTLKGKEVELSDELTRQLLLSLRGNSFKLVIKPNNPRDPSVTYDNMSVTEVAAPLKFYVQNQPDGLSLHLENEEVLIPLTGEWDFFLLGDQLFYPGETAQSRILPLLMNLVGKKGGALHISDQYQEQFLSRLLPVLEETTDLETDPALASCLNRSPLEVNVYLDYENEAVHAGLEFVYGENILNPFASVDPRKHMQKSGDCIPVRDLDREQRVLQLFERAEFKVKGDRVYLDDEDGIWHFYKEILPELRQSATVFLSERFNRAGVRKNPRFRGKVGINWKLDLLELDLELEEVDREELPAIWQSLREKRKYHRLKDGSILSLEEGVEEGGLKQLECLANALDLEVKDFDKGTIRLPKQQAFQLAQLVETGELTGLEQNRDVDKLLHLVRCPEDADSPAPSCLANILREYQVTGFRWMKTLARCGFSGILADDMGLGKTLQAIALMVSEREENHGELPPDLVVAPASLIYNWVAEINKFAPQLRTAVAAGHPGERREIISGANSAEVVITSYPLLRRDGEIFSEKSFNLCFFDEAQYIKNPGSQTAWWARKISARHRFALTGTPLENSLVELWSIFQCIMPGYLQSQKKFINKYGGSVSEDPAVRKETAASLSAKVRPFILRREKGEVLSELPPKIEHRLISELTGDQKKIYQVYLEQLRGEALRTLDEESFEKNRIKILAGLTRLRQICCHPALFVDGYDGKSAKLLQLEELLRDLISSGHRVLLFSQFTGMLHLIKDMLSREGHHYAYLDGSVKSGDRLQLVEQFNEGSTPMFLISLRAGGTGLNLTGADVVVHYDLWWNPAVEEQAAGRAHRFGQKKVVQVIRLLAKDTIEEKIDELQQKKKELINRVIQPGEDFISTMNEEEIKEILEL